MSVNIQTSSGLKKLTPEVNKSTVIAAIGYTPAKEDVVNTHINDTDIHVTVAEKATWNAKSDFNGDYNSLKNTPDIPELPEWTQDIQDDGQGTYAIVDEQGRKALEISADGTTNLAKLQVNGEDLETIIDSKINAIPDVVIPEEEDPTVEDWAKKENATLIPNDKLSIANWAKAETKPSYSVNEVSNAVPQSRKINNKELSADINLALSDLNEAPDIAETDDGYFIIANESGVKSFEVTPDGITNVAALTIGGESLDSILDNKIPEFSEIDPTVEDWAREGNTDLIPSSKLPELISAEEDPTVAAWAKNDSEELIPEEKLPEITIPQDTVSKITHFEMYGGDVSLSVQPDGIIYSDEGYFSLENGNDYDFTIAKRIPLVQGNNITFTVAENDPDTLQINAPTKLSELEPDNNNQRVSVSDKEKWNTHIEDIISNPHKVTAEQVGLGDINVDDGGSFILMDPNGNKAFEVTQDGATKVYSLAVDDNAQVKALVVEDAAQINTAYVETLTVGGEDVNETFTNLRGEIQDFYSDVNNNLASYVSLDTTQTVSGSKTYTGQQTFSNGKFAIKANAATDDSWINLTNNTNGAYYAFGIRRPYGTYGLQMKYHPDASNQDTSRPGDPTGTTDLYFDIYHSGNYTKIPVATGSTAGLMSAAHKTAVDGLANTYLAKTDAANTYLAKAGGAMSGAITMNGNNISGAGTITAALFSATSDARLKENLQPLQPHASILSLPTYEFDFIDGPKDQIGCLAQDLAYIHPKLVTVNEDGYLTINETKLVYLLLEEMKKLQFKIVDLESQLNLLK